MNVSPFEFLTVDAVCRLLPSNGWVESPFMDQIIKKKKRKEEKKRENERKARKVKKEKKEKIDKVSVLVLTVWICLKAMMTEKTITKRNEMKKELVPCICTSLISLVPIVRINRGIDQS